MLAMHSADNSQSSGEYYYYLYRRMRLLDITYRQEGSVRLLKKHVLDKHVRLLTRRYYNMETLGDGTLMAALSVVSL